MADDDGAITVRGHLEGQEVAATLRDDGQLTGSPHLVAEVERLIADGVPVGWANMAAAASLDGRDWLRRATLEAPLDLGRARFAGDPPVVDRVRTGA